MIKKIKLDGSYVRLLDKEPFLLPGELILEFQHIGYDLSNAFITLKNGEKIEKFTFEKPFKVPKEFLYAGDLYVKVEMYLGDTKAKDWNCLPIRLVETETGLTGFDLLASLEKKVSESVPKKDFDTLIEKVNEIIKKQNEIADTVSAIKENY